MPLHPQAAAYLAAQPKKDPSIVSAWTPEECRPIRKFLDNLYSTIKRDPVAKVEDRFIEGKGGPLHIRIYHPLQNHQESPPILVYLHGGGWVFYSVETHDPLCRRLANRAAVIIISVDYRLAPEHKHPAGLEDAYTATQWAYQNAASLGGDPCKVAVGGDSAGGHFAAAVTHMARRDADGPKLAFQLLLYPYTGAHPIDKPTQSEIDCADRYGLEPSSRMRLSKATLNSLDEIALPSVSVNQEADLRGLPPAHIITAEFDPLRDMGKIYADRLLAAGVPVTYKCYPGMIHGFMLQGFVVPMNDGILALDEAAAAVRAALLPNGVSQASS